MIRQTKNLAQHLKFAEVTEIRVKKMSETALSARMLRQENVAPTSINISAFLFSVFNVFKSKENLIPKFFTKTGIHVAVANVFLKRYCKILSVNPF